MKKSTKIMIVTAAALVFATGTAEAGRKSCPTGYDQSACAIWKKQQNAPQSYFGGGKSARTCVPILAYNPQAVVLRNRNGGTVTSWRAANINWQSSGRFSEKLGKEVLIGTVCGDPEDFASAGPGGTFCGEVAKSEMSSSENRKLANGIMWPKNDPYCLMSQKDCRKVGMSWK